LLLRLRDGRYGLEALGNEAHDLAVDLIQVLPEAANVWLLSVHTACLPINHKMPGN
jgi:hypothetical protein